MKIEHQGLFRTYERVCMCETISTKWYVQTILPSFLSGYEIFRSGMNYIAYFNV
jgi:hypothetical protein